MGDSHHMDESRTKSVSNPKYRQNKKIKNKNHTHTEET